MFQDDYIDAVDRLGETAKRVYKINPKLNFEVFVHKVDGLSDDTKIETQRDIHQRASDDLIEADHGRFYHIHDLDNVFFICIYFLSFARVLPSLNKTFNIICNNIDLKRLESLIGSFIIIIHIKPYTARYICYMY